MHATTSLQDQFLHQLTEEQAPVVIYLKNGNKLTGQLIDVNSEVLYLNNGMLRMIYRNNVNAVVESSSV